MSQLNTSPKFTLVVETLKACVVYDRLISHYERKFVGEMTEAYSKFGHKMYVSGKQWLLFWNIAIRLNLYDVFESVKESDIDAWIAEKSKKAEPEPDPVELRESNE